MLCIPQGLTVINNTCISQDLELLVISYANNQPADLQLWNDDFYLISLFGINKYLEGNAKNITCSLFRMVVFIR